MELHGPPPSLPPRRFHVGARYVAHNLNLYTPCAQCPGMGNLFYLPPEGIWEDTGRYGRYLGGQFSH